MILPDEYRKTRLGSLVFGLLVLLSCSKTLADDQPHFQQVVDRHFQQWTRGKNDLLSVNRVKELVGHPIIRGAEAAAIASIHCYQRKAGDKAQPLTRAFLTATHHEDATLRRDHPESGGNLSLNYRSFYRHIQTVPRNVFTSDRPSLTGISQGHLGDCYFVAGVGASIIHGPDPIQRLIHHNDDQSIEVRFANGRQVKIPPLTDAQLALGSNAGHQGIWLNVLEMAAGIVEEEDRLLAPKIPLDTLGEGGDSVFTIQLLTGHKATKHVIRFRDAKGQHQAPAEQDVPHLATKFSEWIREGIERRRLVCCGIGRWSVPPGLAQWHQYAIVGLKNHHVEIWNPWGHNYHFTPKGAPGLVHGYHTEGGRFSIPVHDFVRVFGAVNIESDQPIN